MRIVFCVAILLLNTPLLFAQFYEEVTNASGMFHVPIHEDLMGGGVMWLDYNNDGHTDFYATGCRVRDILYENNGDGTFTDVTIAAGLTFTDSFNTMGCVKGDVNNDGWDDIFLTVWDESANDELARNVLYLNNADGTFSDISVSAGITDVSWSTSAAFLDVNLDGYLDIYVLNYLEDTEFIQDENNITIGFNHSCYANYLYINNGDLTFTEKAEEYGINSLGCGLALSVSDVDKDGDPDIQIANDFGEFTIPNDLFINNYPAENFSNLNEETGFNVGLYGMGVAVGDIDNDLDQDFYITNMGRNVLLENNQGNFTDITESAGVENTGDGSLLYTSWGDMFLDVDNDSYLDLYVANGHMSAAPFIQNVMDDPDKLYMNNGDLTFTDVSDENDISYRGICRGSAYADPDKDGDLDIAVSGIQNPFLNTLQGIRYYKNVGEDLGNFIAFTLEGTTANRNAYGSGITLYAGENTFYRELLGGSSHLSQNESIIHFGLGEITEVDSINVHWIGGTTEIVENLEVNTYNHIIQSIDLSVSETVNNMEFSLYPNPVKSGDAVSFYSSAEAELKMHSLDGKLLFSASINSGVSKVHLDLGSGIYIATLKTARTKWVEKIHITN